MKSAFAYRDSPNGNNGKGDRAETEQQRKKWPHSLARRGDAGYQNFQPETRWKAAQSEDGCGNGHRTPSGNALVCIFQFNRRHKIILIGEQFVYPHDDSRW